MASGFEGGNIKCQGCHKDDLHHDVTYRTEVNLRLCDNCARERKELTEGMEKKAKWFCARHRDKSAELFCDTHTIAICQICALTRSHKQCDLKEIIDEIVDREQRRRELVQKGEEKRYALKELDESVKCSTQEVETCLTELEENARTVVQDHKSKVLTEKVSREEVINREADEQIAIINEKRNSSLKENEDDANCKIDTIEGEEQELNVDLSRLKDVFRQSLHNWNAQGSTLEEILTQAKGLVIGNEESMKDFEHIIKELEGKSETDANTKDIDNVSSLIKNVSLRRIGERQVGRLGIFSWDREYLFDKGIDLVSNVIGSIGRNEVVIQDGDTIHVKNVENKTTRTVLKCKESYRMWSCVPLTDGRIVCGTDGGQLLVYDHAWKFIRTIDLKDRHRRWSSAEDLGVRLSKNGNKLLTCVSVGKAGQIHAAICGEDTVLVFNPDDGKLVGTVTIHEQPINEIYCLSSGDIVIRSECTSGPDVCLVGRSGEVKQTLHFHGKDDFYSCTADPSIDSVYIFYFDSQKKQFFIDLVTFADGVNTYTELVVARPTPYGCCECLVPESGKLVTLINETITQYKLTTTHVAEILDSMKKVENL